MEGGQEVTEVKAEGMTAESAEPESERGRRTADTFLIKTVSRRN